MYPEEDSTPELGKKEIFRDGKVYWGDRGKIADDAYGKRNFYAAVNAILPKELLMKRIELEGPPEGKS